MFQIAQLERARQEAQAVAEEVSQKHAAKYTQINMGH